MLVYTNTFENIKTKGISFTLKINIMQVIMKL